MRFERLSRIFAQAIMSERHMCSIIATQVEFVVELDVSIVMRGERWAVRFSQRSPLYVVWSGAWVNE